MNFQIKEYPHLQFGSLYCIGRNYTRHIEEMKSKRTETPVVFLKPRSSLVFDGDTILLPSQSASVHHEVELVLLIGKETKDVAISSALQSILAVAVGLDMTARDLQSHAKQNGLPWTLAKGFNTFAPVGNFAEFSPEIDVQDLNIQIRINNEIRQDGNTSGMLFSIAEIISYLSRQFTLNPGDLIFTGTPEGVGPVADGDILEASLGHQLSNLKVYVRS